jgi:hypothetical protein
MDPRLESLIKHLEANGRKTADWFSALPEAAHHRVVYSDEVQWSVRRLLAHLITIEKSMQALFRNILAGGHGAPEDFDMDRFNRTQPQKLDHLSMGELVQGFRNVREETVDIVRGMSASDLDREGRHAFHGHGRLERFIHWAHEHVDIHLADAEKATATAAASPDSD